MAFVTSNIQYPMNKWNKNFISPGPVASVGDVLTSVRIKQSLPDMPFAYSKQFNPSNEMKRGSNVQDGQWASFSDGGYNAIVKRARLEKEDSFKTVTGWIHQDIIPVDRLQEPKVQPQGQVGWNTQVAAIKTQRGSPFQELAGGYSPPEGVLLRGNQFPRIITPLGERTYDSSSIVGPSSEQITNLVKSKSAGIPFIKKE